MRELKPLPLAALTVWPSLALLLLTQRTVSPRWIVIVFGSNPNLEGLLPTIETEFPPAAARAATNVLWPGGADSAVAPLLGRGRAPAGVASSGKPPSPVAGTGFDLPPPAAGVDDPEVSGGGVTTCEPGSPGDGGGEAAGAPGIASPTTRTAPLRATAIALDRVRPDDLPPPTKHPRIREAAPSGSTPGGGEALSVRADLAQDSLQARLT